MEQNVPKQTGLLQNLYIDIEKILDYIEFKDLAAANAAETEESKRYAELWMNAIVYSDNYITYKNWWTKEMFQEVQPNIKTIDYGNYISNPYTVPLKFREVLLERGRNAFLNSYVEKNEYYRMLNGLPPIDTNDYVYLSGDLAEQLHVSKGTPVHELSTYVQNSYMNTDEYKRVLADNPDKKYLKYLGRYKIDIYRARYAKDFEIIRYPNNRTDINPYLLNAFSSLYNDYREYVMVVLYNKQLEGIYTNYRTFMGMLIIAFTLLQIGNKAVEAKNDHKYLDDTALHTVLSMYGVPDSPLMTNEVRRELVLNLLKLIQEKGTDDVYYHLVQVLGYQDVTISKLMLMKPRSDDDDPYFLQIDLKDRNPYETIVNGDAPLYTYEEITNPDPMWWDLEDVQKIIRTKPYSISDSKYIVIDSVIHQMQYMFEAVYFARMILDNRDNSDNFLMEIPELFGTEQLSIFSLILFLVCVTCKMGDLSGTIPKYDGRLLATAGFNFDLDMDEFVKYVNKTTYVDKERLMKYMENLTMENTADVNRIFNDVMYPLREWLEQKISTSLIKDEFIEYENIYRALFTYDISRNKFLDNFYEDKLYRDFGLTKEDLETYRHYYLPDGTISVKYYYQDYYQSHLVDKGTVKLSDILKNEDLEEITNKNADRVFMNCESDDGWTLDRDAINAALSAIENLTESDLIKEDDQISHRNDIPPLPDTLRDINTCKAVFSLRLDLPDTYEDLLKLSNEKLYEKLQEGNGLNSNDLANSAWMSDIMNIILAVESELNIHMKYYEQSIVGTQLFFKPLITLIKHFKSILVEIAGSRLKYEFDDKMDSGGYSNMFKFFDVMQCLVHFSTIGGSGYNAQFGFYDTEHIMKHHILMRDRSEMLKMIIGEGFAAEERKTRMGSMRMVDEAKFFKNGKPIDPNGHYSAWYVGEPGLGRWSDDDDHLVRTRTSVERVQTMPVDLDGWKDFVESYNG